MEGTIESGQKGLKTGGHNSTVIIAGGLVILLTNAIGYMAFLALSTGFRTKEGVVKHLQGRLITLGLRVSNNKVLTSYETQTLNLPECRAKQATPSIFQQFDWFWIAKAS